MARIIYGSEVSLEIKEELKNEIDKLVQAGKRLPHLAVVLVGEDPASISYVRGKEKACNQIGMKSSVIKLTDQVEEKEMINLIQQLNEDDSVDGILVQLPLPK